MVTGEVLGAEVGMGESRSRLRLGSAGTQDGGLAVGSLFHGMQTLTHTLKELKNTLNHEVSIPPSPPETQKNAWLIQEPPPWNKAAVWARGWGGVGAASFLSRGKAQRQGRGPRQGGSTLTAIGSGCANQGPSQSLP